MRGMAAALLPLAMPAIVADSPRNPAPAGVVPAGAGHHHRLQLLLGDHLHLPHDPPAVSAPITITVE